MEWICTIILLGLMCCRPGPPLANGPRRRNNKVAPKPKATGEDLFVLQPTDPFKDNAAPAGR